LGEVEVDLAKQRTRAGKAQAGYTLAKRKVGEAQQEHAKQLEVAKKKRAEAAQKERLAAVVKEVRELVEGFETDASKVSADAAQALKAANSVPGREQQMGVLESIGQSCSQLQRLLSALSDASKKLKEKREEVGTAGISQVQTFILKMASLESRCRQQAKALEASRAKLAAEAERKVAEALRAHARQAGLDAGALFAELSGAAAGASPDEASLAPEAALRALLERSGAAVEAADLELGLARFRSSGGASRFEVAEMVQEYLRVVKDTLVTPSLEVREGKPLRKLERGEVVEMLGEPTKDPEHGLERARCRALRDALEGWVTLRGNQGTAFFEPAAKPYLRCHAGGAVPLRSTCARGGEEIGAAPAGEVLEFLEGPRREEAKPSGPLFARCRGLNCGLEGWCVMDASVGEWSPELPGSTPA